jgi:hypothetical protein
MICWFCSKGRCTECMIEMPFQASFEGTVDCSFDVTYKKCECQH